MKVSELTGAKLNYWVAKADGKDAEIVPQRVFGSGYGITLVDGTPACMVGIDYFDPSTNWAHGGPIIEREQITVECWQDTDGRSGMRDVFWSASIHGSMKNEGREGYEDGPSPLIAAMRAFVASKYGEEVAGE